MPGDLALLPGRDGKAAGAVLVLSAKPTLWDFGALATKLPAGTWRLASDTAPVSPTDAAVAIGLGTWRFERYRSKKAKAGRQDHLAAGRRQGARHGDHRIDLHGARSHHHAVVRHGAGRARRGGPGARQDAQGQDPRDRGRRSSEAELSHGACRRPRQQPRAAADRPRVGPRERSQGHPGRQGRVLRYRRPRPQARHRHAEHEEGHGGCGDHDGRRLHGDGDQPAGAPAPAGAGGREQRVGQRLPAARRGADAQGHHRRDRQHRRRGKADPVRCPARGRLGEARR